MRMYHTTTDAAAQSILDQGFSDGPVYPEFGISGVWLSNVPVDQSEGAKGAVLLEVNTTLTEADIADYELVEEGKPYREWCLPANILNPTATVQFAVEDDTFRSEMTNEDK